MVTLEIYLGSHGVVQALPSSPEGLPLPRFQTQILPSSLWRRGHGLHPGLSGCKEARCHQPAVLALVPVQTNIPTGSGPDHA